MNRQPPQEFIIVEGRSDTARLREVYGDGVRTIETQGSAIDSQVLDRIRAVYEQFGAIVLTDPDYPGQRIRSIITEHFPQIKQAYIHKHDAMGKKPHQNVGVEYASDEMIIRALEQVMVPQERSRQELIPKHLLVDLGLVGGRESSKLRDILAQHYQLGPMNGKQLQRQLALYGITYQEIKEVLSQHGYESELHSDTHTDSSNNEGT